MDHKTPADVIGILVEEDEQDFYVHHPPVVDLDLWVHYRIFFMRTAIENGELNFGVQLRVYAHVGIVIENEGDKLNLGVQLCILVVETVIESYGLNFCVHLCLPVCASVA